MAKSEVTINAKGVDKTGGMFASIRQRMKTLGGDIKTGIGHWIGGSIAETTIRGISKALTAVKDVSAELSVLSDRASQCGTKSSDLQKLSTAFGVLGVKGADIETLTSGLQKMTQTTGRVGIEGLKETLKAALPRPRGAEEC